MSSPTLDELAQSIQSEEHQERLRAVRYIKNSVIGNRTKKEQYLRSGFADLLVKLLCSSTVDVNLRTQVAAVLGSLAYGGAENIDVLANAGVVAPLLETLSATDLKLVEAGARALRAIFQSPKAPREGILQEKNLEALVRLLVPNESGMVLNSTSAPGSIAVRISEVAAGLLSRICCTQQEQIQIAKTGAVTFLIAYLDIRWNTCPKLQEAALDALANICKDNPMTARMITAFKSTNGTDKPIGHLLRLVKDHRPVTRLMAASCLTNLFRTGALSPELQQESILVVLPILIKLFAEEAALNSMYGQGWSSVKERAPHIFAELVEPSENLQMAALEADAVAKLAAVLTKECGEAVNDVPDSRCKARGETRKGPPRKVHPVSPHGERHKEGLFRAIAAVCSLREDCRKQVIDAKLLPQIVSAMSHPDRRIRVAACECTRSLSRSVKNLRTSLVDAGVGVPLLKLLSDESIDVQRTASATLCNIVLDFSPMKKTVLESSGVERLVDLVKSMDERLRLNAVWALKNLLFQADSDIKDRVMRELGWEGLTGLLQDGESGMQEQALNLLRNLACGKESDIEQAFNGMGEARIMDILQDKLSASPQVDDIILQALYVIVNVSTGNERHKNAIMSRPVLLTRISNFMSHSKSLIRVATVWCVINLTWTDDPGSVERVSKLKELGFEQRLLGLVDDDNMDVKDRVKTAVANFAAHLDVAILPGNLPGNTEELTTGPRTGRREREAVVFGTLGTGSAEGSSVNYQ